MDFSLVEKTAHYQPWIDRERIEQSVLGVLLPGGVAVPTPDQVVASLAAAGHQLLDITVEPSTRFSPTGWELTAIIERGGTPTAFTFEVLPSPTDDLPLPSNLDEAQRELTASSEWSIAVVTEYGDTVLSDFHHHLRVAAAAVAEPAAYYDHSCLTFRTADWVRRAADSPAPPPVEALFVIHAVGPDENGGVWLHTHGLDRCGALDLEIVGLGQESFQAFGVLMNVAASRFIEPTVRPAGEVLVLGRGIHVTWVPWESLEDIAGRLPDGMIGGPADHVEGHATPRASLLAARGDDGEEAEDIAPLDVYEDILRNEPLFYLSPMETDRMRILARSELERFHRLLDRFGGAEGWGFLVKLGYPVSGVDEDDAPTDGREHLWFEVHGIDGDHVDATLNNEPYAVDLLKGQRARHPLGFLSDFRVYSPAGVFGPDRIGDLVLRLPSADPR